MKLLSKHEDFMRAFLWRRNFIRILFLNQFVSNRNCLWRTDFNRKKFVEKDMGKI